MYRNIMQRPKPTREQYEAELLADMTAAPLGARYPLWRGVMARGIDPATVEDVFGGFVRAGYGYLDGRVFVLDAVPVVEGVGDGDV